MKSRITVNPQIHFGKPCISGTRIPVLDVLELIGDGITFETILKDYYPALVQEDLQACVRYAIDVLQAEDLHISEPV